MPMCLSNSLKGVRIYGYDDLRQAVLRAYMERVDLPGSIARRGRIARARAIYTSKLDRVFSILAEYVGSCARLPRISSIHPFYAEVAMIASGGMYEALVDRCRKVVHLAASLYREYRGKICSSEDPSEIEKLAREYVGRCLSIVRRGLKGVERIRDAVLEISRSPCVSEDTANIVISGMPQVGKSTLVSRISTAKPEISPFPFTTKRVVMGHLDIGDRRFAIIDTPGILDRPEEEMNEIELKAVSAIRHIADLAVFLIDPRSSAYYTLDQQLKVLQGIEKILGRDRVLVAINKVDIASKEEVERCLSRLKDLGYRQVYLISALKGEGVDNLVNRVAEILSHRGAGDRAETISKTA